MTAGSIVALAYSMRLLIRSRFVKTLVPSIFARVRAERSYEDPKAPVSTGDFLYWVTLLLLGSDQSSDWIPLVLSLVPIPIIWTVYHGDTSLKWGVTIAILAAPCAWGLWRVYGRSGDLEQDRRDYVESQDTPRFWAMTILLWPILLSLSIVVRNLHLPCFLCLD